MRPPTGPGTRSGPAAAAAAAVLALAAPGAAVAGVSTALDHLSGARLAATGAPSAPGDPPSRVHALAAWTSLAVAAASEDPSAWRVGGRGLWGAVGRRPGTGVVAVARWCLAARASGRLTPRDAAAARLTLGAARPVGALEAAWALLGLRVVDTVPPAALLQEVRAAQQPGGGWGSAPGASADTPATSAAVQALVAWGESPSGEVLTRARAWLAAAQRRDGGVPPIPGTASRAVDTAWAAMAVWALGESPAAGDWARGGGMPGFLRARQRPDGGVPDTATGPTSVFATALTVLALTGRPLPVAPGRAGVAVPRAPRVVARQPASGQPASSLIVVRYRDDPGGTGVDPAGVRLVVGGVDRTAAARVSRLSLQVRTALVGPLPAVVALTLVDRAGNRRTERWTIAAPE